MLFASSMAIVLQSVFLLACSMLSIGGSERKQRRARKGTIFNFVSFANLTGNNLYKAAKKKVSKQSREGLLRTTADWDEVGYDITPGPKSPLRSRD